MKTHLNFATSDLESGVRFYSALLDAKPTKVKADYALFVLEDPALELALDVSSKVSPTRDAHFGIFVETVRDVERAIERLEAAGLASSVEREETCRYANQTKVWAIDPDGRRWEVYTVHEETEERDEAGTTCCCCDGSRCACCDGSSCACCAA
jgi:catechol 2,3-dioxygenase-like lactoylglutathione lyase family enzyme